MTDNHPLDNHLRDVPLPDGLQERLKGICALSDEELDYRLRDVAVPGRVIERVRRIPRDEVLDSFLRELPVPNRAIARSRIVPQEKSHWRIGRLALALSLIFVLASAHVSILAWLLKPFQPSDEEQSTLLVIDQGPLKIISPQQEIEADTVYISTTANVPEVLWPSTPKFAEPIVSLDDSYEDWEKSTPGLVGQLIDDMNSKWNPSENWLVASLGILGSSETIDERPTELQSYPSLDPRGLKPSLERGLDRQFLRSKNAHPPVLTSTAGRLLTASAPLAIGTGSFERAKQAVARGRLPSQADIRVEDFLAAMDYRFEKAQRGQIELRTQAGPSFFNPFNTLSGKPAPFEPNMLQIGVIAGTPTMRPKSSATHLTVALDVSANMVQDDRLVKAKKALTQLLRHLEPRDRFSLLVFNDEAAVVVADIGPNEVKDATKLIRNLQAFGGANTAQALPRAIAAAFETDAIRATSRLVMITDSQLELPTETFGRLKSMLEQAAVRGLTFDVLDIAKRGDDESREGGQLRQLAEATGGKLHLCCLDESLRAGTSNSIVTAEAMRWSLVDALVGGSSVVANDARLRVRFNPQVVAAYRLVGHEADLVTGAKTETGEFELHCGQQATSLFEVWLSPNASSGTQVATVRLEWIDPATGQTRRARPARVDMSAFDGTLNGRPALQAAEIAAETAEVLRQSYNFNILSRFAYRYQPKPRDLRAVLKAVDSADSRVKTQAEFRDFVDFLESAKRLIARRSGGSTKIGVRTTNNGKWFETSKR